MGMKKALHCSRCRAPFDESRFEKELVTQGEREWDIYTRDTWPRPGQVKVYASVGTQASELGQRLREPGASSTISRDTPPPTLHPRRDQAVTDVTAGERTRPQKRVQVQNPDPRFTRAKAIWGPRLSVGNLYSGSCHEDLEVYRYDICLPLRCSFNATGRDTRSDPFTPPRFTIAKLTVLMVQTLSHSLSRSRSLCNLLSIFSGISENARLTLIIFHSTVKLSSLFIFTQFIIRNCRKK